MMNDPMRRKLIDKGRPNDRINMRVSEFQQLLEEDRQKQRDLAGIPSASPLATSELPPTLEKAPLEPLAVAPETINVEKVQTTWELPARKHTSTTQLTRSIMQQMLELLHHRLPRIWNKLCDVAESDGARSIQATNTILKLASNYFQVVEKLEKSIPERERKMAGVECVECVSEEPQRFEESPASLAV